MIQRVKTIKLQLPHPLMVWALLWTELNEKNREKIVLAVIIQYTDPTIMTVGNTNAAIVFLYFAIRDPYAGDVISVSPIWEYIIPPAKENKIISAVMETYKALGLINNLSLHQDLLEDIDLKPLHQIVSYHSLQMIMIIINFMHLPHFLLMIYLQHRQILTQQQELH